MRASNRRPDQMREVSITRNYLKNAAGSAFIEMGNTKVICAATFEDTVPKFLQNSGGGWVTAEYSMLPASTKTRTQRESARGRIGGRTHEIQRIIGRSLRAVTDLKSLGERTVYIDCDVIQADGGTRTASITGGFVALVEALRNMRQQGRLESFPVTEYISAVSVGVVGGEALLDLDYDEDSRAAVDMNFVMTGTGKFIDIQGTAEEAPFSMTSFMSMVELAEKGISELTARLKNILGELS